MARLRSSSSKSKRALSRLLVGVLIVALGGLALYQFDFFTGGDDASADQLVSAGSPQQPINTPAPVTTETPVGTNAPSEWDPTGDATDVEDDGLASPAPKPKAAEKSDDDDNGDDWGTNIAPSGTFLGDAQDKIDRGDLLEARTILNDALQSGMLTSADANVTKAKMRDINRVVVFTPTKRYKADPYQSEYTVQSGDLLGKIVQSQKLYIPYGFLERINATRANRIRVGQTLKTVQGPIHAVVSKGKFEMDLYLKALPGQPDSMYLTTYKVGLGEDSSTPTGLWEVTLGSKLKNPEWTNPRTSEVFAADNPDNPLGERWLGLTGIAGDALGQPSYGIHGTIEPETIGTNASMGCIRLVHDDIVEIFDMLYESRSTVKVVE